MYNFHSRIRYSEVDHNKKLDLSSIINYFQDCSTFQSEDLGVGIDYLSKANRAWLLSSWQIIINEYPEFGEDITTSTWAYDFDSIYGYRNFIMKSKKDKVFAYANSIWIYVDTSSGRPTRITDNVGKVYQTEERLDMDYAPRKIGLPKELSTLPSFPVVRSNIDTNNHVNNGQYINMAEEFLPEEFKIKEMRADYKNAAKLGDIIIPKIAQVDNGYIIVLSDTKGKPYTIMEFK